MSRSSVKDQRYLTLKCRSLRTFSNWINHLQNTKLFFKIWGKKEKPAVQLVRMSIHHIYIRTISAISAINLIKKTKATKVLLRHSLQLTGKESNVEKKVVSFFRITREMIFDDFGEKIKNWHQSWFIFSNSVNITLKNNFSPLLEKKDF